MLVAAYLGASLGVLPSGAVISEWFGQTMGERFPCEDCGCGCTSARECWTHCCCHTEHERLEWAIKSGVMPPAEVEFSDAQWIAAANGVRWGSAHCALCVERIKGELRRGIATRPDHGAGCEGAGRCDDQGGKVCGGTLTAGEPEGGASCCAERDAENARSWPGPRASALSCKGLQQLLTMTLPPTPPVRVVELIVSEPAVLAAGWPSDVEYRTRTLDVAEPPPRGGKSISGVIV